MRSHWFALSALGVIAAAACAHSSTDPDLRYAAATLWCAPNDAGITGILLGRNPITSQQPSFPHVRVVLPEYVTALPGRRFNIGSGASDATAVFINGRPFAEPATFGHVTIASVDSTKRVRGSLELQFGSRMVATDFDAVWIEPFMLCG